MKATISIHHSAAHLKKFIMWRQIRVITQPLVCSKIILKPWVRIEQASTVLMY